MYQPTIGDRLVEAQTKCFNAQTEQLVELINDYENRDDMIKMLIDERRRVYLEFTKRIDAAEASEGT